MTKLLLVEDNEGSRDMLKRRLERRGFAVVTATDGVEGLHMARSEKPALILMDLRLPLVDGWEALRRLRTFPETVQIPVIALTANALLSDRERALAVGFDDFDTKPVELQRLIGKIENLLRESSV
jgi:CheY-like chemotaxis protein